MQSISFCAESQSERGEVAKYLEKGGVARRFELAMDRWVGLVDGAAERAAVDKAAKKWGLKAISKAVI